MSSLFRRREDTAPSGPAPAALAATGPATPTGEAGVELDALAQLLQVYGEQGFDVEARTAVELERRCQAWVRHLLTGTPAPTEGEPAEPAPAATSRKHWADLQQFFRQHRRSERTLVSNQNEQLRELVSEVAQALRRAIADDSASDELIARELAALSEALESNSMTVIRAQVGKTVEAVSVVVRERQARYKAQLRSMSERLRSLRADLVELSEQANLDRLTQVHNRRCFDLVLAKQVDFSLLTGQPLALLMIDLDHFKQINDSFGHLGGDCVLKAAADTIVRACPRRSDLVARFGGEEFAVILLDVSPKDLSVICERLLHAMRQLQIHHDGVTITVRCSVGAALFRSEDTAEALLRRADQALYKAKGEGRDRAVIEVGRSA